MIAMKETDGTSAFADRFRYLELVPLLYDAFDMAVMVQPRVSRSVYWHGRTKPIVRVNAQEPSVLK